MAFKRFRGKTKIMYFKGDTAREVRHGSLVGLNDSAAVDYCASDSLDRIIGVARRNDTVTDSALVPVEVPVENAVEWLIDVDSDGGAADSDVGKYCGVDTVGGASVNAGDSAAMRADVSDTTSPDIFITARLSGTQIVGVLSRLAWTRTFDSHDTSR